VGNPLLGFGPPTRYSRSLRHRSLDRRHLSWGFTPLRRTGRRESTSDFRRLPGFAGVSVRGSHPADYGVAHRFSQPLSDLLPLSTVPPFSGGWRPCGSPSRGLFLSRSPARLVVVRLTLLTLLPRADRSPFLGGNTRRRCGSYLGAFSHSLLFVYRVFVLVKVDRTFKPFSQLTCPTCPSWAFTSSWFAPERNGEGFPPRDRRASRARGRRLPLTRCPPRLPDHPGRPTLTSGPSHLKVSRRQLPLPFGVLPDAGLSALRPFASIRGTPSPGPMQTS